MIGHHHHHEHGPANYDRAFAIGVALNVIIVVVQFGFGIAASSLALLADASHNLSDVLGLLLAWGAAVLGRRAPSGRRTYGWRRSTILAALANALALILVTGGIAWEAIRRIAEPSPVEGGIVVGAAAIAALVNGGAALLFLKGREHDLNLRGAYLHLMSDAGVSLGVAITGLALLVTGWLWLDPVISLAISVIILLSTWSLLRGSLNLAMDVVPDSVDIEEVREFLTELPSVAGVHHLHVWAMSTTEVALTVHLALRESGLNDALIAEINEELCEHFGIDHATIQLEEQELDHACPLEEPPHVHVLHAVDHGHTAHVH